MNGRLNGMANTATDSVVVTGIEYIGLHGEYVLDAFRFLDASVCIFLRPMLTRRLFVALAKGSS